MLSFRYVPALGALAALAACAGPPPAAANADDGAPVGSMGAPAPVASGQTLPADVPAANASSPVQTAKVEADYVGKWIGPEGLVLEVAPKAGGGVTVVNRYTLDDEGTFDGSVTAEGLRFTRGTETVVAVPSDGDGTGMKWLAGKRDCLTVKPGSEGYCRR